MNRIAIIGSGITGISVAFQHPPNSHITMFDKSRKPGGRVSTRTSRQHPGYSFDHGAPFVYAKG
jgi:predicted NAD/FAD-dependent oxidoreductase